VRKGFFSKDEFRYDPARDVYICPAGETLAPHHDGRLRDLKKIDYSNRAACVVCPLRSRCTTSHRRVSRGRAGPDGRPTEGQAVFWLK
jgi:transposase